MEMLGKIRRIHLRDKLSLHEIARRTGLSRNTVRTWLRKPEPKAAPEYRRRPGGTKLAPFHDAIIQALKADAIVASHARSMDRGNVCYDWQHYVALVERKPGALRNGAPFNDLPPPLQQLRHGLLRHPGGDRLMARVLATIPGSGLDAVLVAVELVIESGVLSVEHVENVLARLHASPPPPSATTTLRLTEAPMADAARYDELRALMESEDDHA